ncbi:hypothetical protein BH20ACT3_BH20ACT3_10500 [soil metagenome]
MNVNRWVKYAKARIDAAVGQGHDSLDRREDERRAEVAERPWLAADGTAPSLDEARARIEWEARQQEQLHSDWSADPRTSTARARTEREHAPSDPHDRDTDGSETASPLDPGPRAREQVAADAEHEAARLELEDRSRRSADRLAESRRELGGDDAP